MPPSRATVTLGNLPPELTTFVGRRDDVAELKQHLAAARLVTLTGPGGVGKTRLALRVAHELARGYPSGAWLVDLSAATDADGVARAIFAALGLQDRSASWSVAELAAYLADKRPLLILDNCEQVLVPAAVLAGTLLRQAPGSRFLATSRQALGVVGEVVVDVAPLSLPHAGAASSDVVRSDAVALFAERAAAVEPSFVVDTASAPLVLAICARLDGLPLALELAAVRLKALGLEGLESGLRHRLSVLGAGDPSVSPRQQTLDAAIDWSYQLLTPAERLLWARLSVFADGFQLEAAAEVCGDEQLPASEVGALVGGLVEKSVIKRRPSPGGDRFRMLHPLREFGLARLEERGETRSMRLRHRDWVARIAADVGAQDERQVELFAVVVRERSNIWSAIDFCVSDPEQRDMAIRICVDLWVFWSSQGPITDVRRVLARLAETSVDAHLRAPLLWVSGVLAFQQNDYPSSRAMVEEVLAIGRALGDAGIVARALAFLSSIAWVENRPDDAVALGDESIQLTRTMGLEDVRLRSTIARGYAHLAHGQFANAARLALEAVEQSRRLGETWNRGIAYQLLAGAMFGIGDLDEAVSHAQASLGFERALDDRTGMAHTTALLAEIEGARGDAERSAILLGSAEAILRSIPSSLMQPFQAPYDAAVGAARSSLGDRRYEVAFETGLALARDEVLAFAVDGRLPDTTSSTPVKARNDAGPLSRREMEVASLVADGASNAAVAERLFISERTVESHLASIFNKLGVDSRMQVARWVTAREALPG